MEIREWTDTVRPWARSYLKVGEDLRPGCRIGDLHLDILHVHLQPVHPVAEVTAVISGHQVVAHHLAVFGGRSSFAQALPDEPDHLLLGHHRLPASPAGGHSPYPGPTVLRRVWQEFRRCPRRSQQISVQRRHWGHVDGPIDLTQPSLSPRGFNFIKQQTGAEKLQMHWPSVYRELADSRNSVGPGYRLLSVLSTRGVLIIRREQCFSATGEPSRFSIPSAASTCKDVPIARSNHGPLSIPAPQSSARSNFPPRRTRSATTALVALLRNCYQ